MSRELPSSVFASQAVNEIRNWAGTLGPNVVIEQIGNLFRIKLAGVDSRQSMFVRADSRSDHVEPYLNDPTEEEVAFLKAGFSSSDDVIFPYLRGGRGRGALLRVRNQNDLNTVKTVLEGRVLKLDSR